MAPLGIVTALVGAVRIGGAKSLKALVGRARENVVQAELELMSSTSEEVCELWNGKAIIRTIGRPRVKEIIHAPKEKGDISPESFITLDPATHSQGYTLRCLEEPLEKPQAGKLAEELRTGNIFTFSPLNEARLI